MDDFSLSSLSSSKDEWCSRLLSMITGPVIDGFRSIFTEANELCITNEEDDQYLITFQTFLARVPKWNTEIVNTECKRIEEATGCSYLEDLITCVHIINLKALSCMRVGHSHKDVTIDIPKLADFIHKTYVVCARKIYANVYLFEKSAAPLDVQRNNRELELLVKEGILETIRDNVPADRILKSYLEQTEEVESKIESTKAKELPKLESSVSDQPAKPSISQVRPVPPAKPDLSIYKPPEIPKYSGPTKSLSAPTSPYTEPVKRDQNAIKFSHVDGAIDIEGKQSTIDAPKTIERLEKISEERNELRKQEEEEEEDFKIKIGEEVKLDIQGIKATKDRNSQGTPPKIEITDI